MKILLITLAVILLMFLFDLVFRKTVEGHPFILGKYKIHHSVLGIFLLIVGAVLDNTVLLSIGLGMYLAHGLEEMYFDKTRLPKAFFVFITRV